MNITPTISDPVRQTPPYSMLARVYDRMMVHVNYRKWAAYIVAILKEERFWPERKLLDIGCGTGRFLEEAQLVGQAGDGCDPSPEMLSVARKRLPDFRFFQCSLPEINEIRVGVYPVFTCLYDTMNYLPDETSFLQSLLFLYEKLPSPGLFIFDLVSETHCKHYFRNYRDSEVLSKTVAYSRESHYDPRENFQYNWIRVYFEDKVFEEEHRQKIYNFRKIKELILETTDFKLKNVYNEFTFRQANSASSRAHFVLRKN